MPTSSARPARRATSIALVALAAAVAAGGALTTAQAPVAAPVYRTSLHDFRLETVAMLQHPHSIAFTPEGDMLVTERPGRLRIVRKGVLLAEPVAGLPDILFLGNGATVAGRPRAGRAARRGAASGSSPRTGCSTSAT